MGDWDGVVTISVAPPEGGPAMPICTADITVAVDEAGAFSGDAECMDDQGHPLQIAVDGTVGDDGAATGTATQTLGDGTAVDDDLSGTFATDAASLAWSGEIPDPRGEQVPYEGSVTASPAAGGP